MKLVQYFQQLFPKLKYSIKTVSEWLVIRSFNYYTLLSAAVIAKNWAWSGQNLIIGLNRCDVNRWSFLCKPRGCLPSTHFIVSAPLWTASHSIRGFMFYERGWIRDHICNWWKDWVCCEGCHMRPSPDLCFIFNHIPSVFMWHRIQLPPLTNECCHKKLPDNLETNLISVSPKQYIRGNSSRNRQNAPRVIKRRTSSLWQRTAGNELTWNEAEVRLHRRICVQNVGNIWPLQRVGFGFTFCYRWSDWTSMVSYVNIAQSIIAPINCSLCVSFHCVLDAFTLRYFSGNVEDQENGRSPASQKGNEAFREHVLLV